MGRSLRITLFVLLLLVVLIFGLTVGRQVFLGSSEPAPAPDLSQYNTYVYDQPRELAEFTLTNEQGETVTRDSLKGRWTFVFVGYTNCPDICPAAMANLRRTNSLLPADQPRPDHLLVCRHQKAIRPGQVDRQPAV